jgi:hypothetical protein
MSPNSKNATTTLGRREFVVAGASLAVTPLLGGPVAAAQDGAKDTSVGKGPASSSTWPRLGRGHKRRFRPLRFVLRNSCRPNEPIEI